ncbi:MAG: helix-turn-helix domain-containing protein [Myxococcota bacterium]|nr:helix-turn-helix domain-containing protein [Myxococcota bacterium]
MRGAFTPAIALKTLRELQGLSQKQLADASGIGQPIISAMEHGRVAVGIERAKKLARALRVHPAVIAFAGWEEDSKPTRARAHRAA